MATRRAKAGRVRRRLTRAQFIDALLMRLETRRAVYADTATRMQGKVWLRFEVEKAIRDVQLLSRRRSQ